MKTKNKLQSPVRIATAALLAASMTYSSHSQAVVITAPVSIPTSLIIKSAAGGLVLVSVSARAQNKQDEGKNTSPDGTGGRKGTRTAPVGGNSVPGDSLGGERAPTDNGYGPNLDEGGNSGGALFSKAGGKSTPDTPRPKGNRGQSQGGNSVPGDSIGGGERQPSAPGYGPRLDEGGSRGDGGARGDEQGNFGYLKTITKDAGLQTIKAGLSVVKAWNSLSPNQKAVAKTVAVLGVIALDTKASDVRDINSDLAELVNAQAIESVEAETIATELTKMNDVTITLEQIEAAQTEADRKNISLISALAGRLKVSNVTAEYVLRLFGIN